MHSGVCLTAMVFSVDLPLQSFVSKASRARTENKPGNSLHTLCMTIEASLKFFLFCYASCFLTSQATWKKDLLPPTMQCKLVRCSQ